MDVAYVVSGDRLLDGCTLELASAVERAHDSREGALISVVPGRVALIIEGRIRHLEQEIEAFKNARDRAGSEQ